MKIFIIRTLVREYDNTWYLRKLFYGDHDIARQIKKFLADFTSRNDDYELTPADLFKLYRIVKAPNDLSLIQAIHNRLAYLLLEVMNKLDSVDLAGEANFTRIYALDLEGRRTLQDIFTPPVLELFAAQKIINRQKLLDMIIALYNVPENFRLAESIREGLPLLAKNHLITPEILDAIESRKNTISQFVRTLRPLDAVNLLNERSVNTVLACEKEFYFLGSLLSILVQASDKILDADMLEAICKMSNSYLFESVCSVLLKSGCLTRENFKRLLGLDLSQLYYLGNVLKLADDICAFSQPAWEALFVDAYHFYSLIDHLKKLNILSKDTAEKATQILVNGEINAVRSFLTLLAKNKMSLSAANFIQLCVHPSRAKIIKILSEDNSPLACDANITALLHLSEFHLDYIYNFISDVSKVYERDQEAFDKIVAAVTMAQTGGKKRVPATVLNVHGNVAAAIAYIENNQYAVGQQILTAFYLPPYPVNGNAVVKLNLKNGVIERLIHGAMHAGRTSLYVKVLHGIFSQLLPSYTAASIRHLAWFFKLTEKQIIALGRTAMLYHDSAREDEGQDHWDDKSGINCRNFHISLGVDAALAIFLEKSTALKDKPAEFAAYLDSLGIAKNMQVYFQFVRKLIYLADCYDIMRCIGKFELSHVFKCFYDIAEYRQDTHEQTLIELATQIHHLIYIQGDMLHACEIVHPNGTVIRTIDKGKNFNLQQKASFEHAENTISVLVASMQKNPYFARFLTQERLLDTRPAQCQPGFNPHIHGTTSLIFVSMERTNHHLMPVSKMLTDFHLAPMGGEMHSRGLTGPYTGEEISFGIFRDNALAGTNYDLKKVVSDYAALRLRLNRTAGQLIADLKEEIGYGINKGFNNITVILVYLARAKQFGVQTEQLEKEADMSGLLRNLRAVVKVYQLFLLLGKHIHPDFNKFAAYPHKADICDAVYTQLTFANVMQKMTETKLDLPDIYLHPTRENLAEVMKILALPKELDVAPRYDESKTRRVILTETQVFSLEKMKTAAASEDEKDYAQSHANSYFGDLVLGSSRKDTLNKFLLDYISGQFSTEFLQRVAVLMEKYVTDFSRKIDLLNDILHKSYPALTESQRFFINNRFPVILLVENYCDMKDHHVSSSEYRTANRLQLGTDIKMIATDSEEHRLTLMKYLEKNRVQNVQVVLFVDLYLSYQTGLRPQSPYTHADAFPRLSWLAAKACGLRNMNGEQGGAASLLVKADTYQKLKF